MGLITNIYSNVYKFFFRTFFYLFILYSSSLFALNTSSRDEPTEVIHFLVQAFSLPKVTSSNNQIFAMPDVGKTVVELYDVPKNQHDEVIAQLSHAMLKNHWRPIKVDFYETTGWGKNQYMRRYRKNNKLISSINVPYPVVAKAAEILPLETKSKTSVKIEKPSKTKSFNRLLSQIVKIIQTTEHEISIGDGVESIVRANEPVKVSLKIRGASIDTSSDLSIAQLIIKLKKKYASRLKGDDYQLQLTLLPEEASALPSQSVAVNLADLSYPIEWSIHPIASGDMSLKIHQTVTFKSSAGKKGSVIRADSAEFSVADTPALTEQEESKSLPSAWLFSLFSLIFAVFMFWVYREYKGKKPAEVLLKT